MSSKFGPNQVDVLNIWASNSRAKVRAGKLRTENGSLYSYDLLIGIVTQGHPDAAVEHLCLVYDYTGEGKAHVSATTRRHINKAKRYAHLIYPVNLSGNVAWTNPRLGSMIEHWKMAEDSIRG